MAVDVASSGSDVASSGSESDDVSEAAIKKGVLDDSEQEDDELCDLCDEGFDSKRPPSKYQIWGFRRLHTNCFDTLLGARFVGAHP